jgi:hypothetical protein
MVEHRMDVDRHAVDRPLVGENLHAIDQRDDPIRLVADQAGQRAILVLDTELSRSCAAPRMPESGFLISCASIEARPVTDRAAARWVS